MQLSTTNTIIACLHGCLYLYFVVVILGHTDNDAINIIASVSIVGFFYPRIKNVHVLVRIPYTHFKE